MGCIWNEGPSEGHSDASLRWVRIQVLLQDRMRVQNRRTTVLGGRAREDMEVRDGLQIRLPRGCQASTGSLFAWLRRHHRGLRVQKSNENLVNVCPLVLRLSVRNREPSRIRPEEISVPGGSVDILLLNIILAA